MNIIDAAECMGQSDRVQRLEFANPPGLNDVYHYDETLGIVNDDLEPLVFTLGDLRAEDWVVVR